MAEECRMDVNIMYETALSRDRLACLAPPDMVFTHLSTYMYITCIVCQFVHLCLSIPYVYVVFIPVLFDYGKCGGVYP